MHPVDGVQVHITLVNPKTDYKCNCQCLIPIDCLEMDKDTLLRAYGDQLSQTLFDLLSFNNFRKDMGVKEKTKPKAKSKLILDPNQH